MTVILIAAAFLGGALNSLAGGGTLVTFPALLLAGLNPIDANASSVVALFSGTFAGAWAYRRNILAVGEVSVLGLFALSLVGGADWGAIMTTTAVVAFIVADVVRWPETLPMLAGSAFGAYAAAHWAQRLDQRLIKGFVIVLGTGLTAYFAWRGV